MTGGRGAPAVTVAVLNHRRPHLLARVLAGIMQLDYPAFEIVVVGDRPGLADYGLPARLARAVRYFPCDEPNICRARNIAVAGAAGEIVAFCDDDAVPEPDWLSGLAAPFADPAMGAVGGVVRAADGMSLEWRGGMFDRAATEFPLTGEARVFDARTQLEADRFLSLRGVNSAFRRAALHRVGGFDEAYRYYLDETDMALRLAGDGWSAALSQGAEVQHLPEQNIVRGAQRQPRDLFEVAASKAYFCLRHLPEGRVEAELEAWRAARLRELDPHLRLGLLRLADRNRLRRRVDEGLAEGRARAPVLPLGAAEGGAAGAGEAAAAAGAVGGPATPAGRRVVSVRGDVQGGEQVAGRGGANGGGAGIAAGAEAGPLRLSIALVTGWGPLRIARLRAVARQLAASGHSVSCFSYMTGAHAPHVTYQDGVWLHRGGTWRLEKPVNGRRVITRGARARAEIARVMARRRFNIVLRPAPRGDEQRGGGGAVGGADPAALLPVAGMSTPLRVELARDCGLALAEIVHELRRVIDLPRPPASAGREAPGPAVAGPSAHPHAVAR